MEDLIMNVKEKILLVELLLRDVRGNWGWENNKGFCSRVEKARELCDEIADELKDDNYTILSGTCSQYISYAEDGDCDGRFFRAEFPEGYENMGELHGLNFNYMEKSNDFKSVAKAYLTYPEYAFDDWKDYLEA